MEVLYIASIVFFKSPRLPFNWPTIYHAINSTNCPKLCAGCSSKHAQSDCPKQCKFESWKIFHTILVSKFPRESQKFNVDTNPHCNHCTVSPSPESIMYNNLWGFVGHQFARHSPDYCYYISPWYSPLCPHVPTTPSIMRFAAACCADFWCRSLGFGCAAESGTDFGAPAAGEVPLEGTGLVAAFLSDGRFVAVWSCENMWEPLGNRT